MELVWTSIFIFMNLEEVKWQERGQATRLSCCRLQVFQSLHHTNANALIGSRWEGILYPNQQIREGPWDGVLREEETVGSWGRGYGRPPWS